jgi:lipoyl(octanoyl) transferase
MIVQRVLTPDYLPVYEAMQRFTLERVPNTADELWLCEHAPVYTLGLASKPEHLRLVQQQHPDVPIVPTNRGGQVTYHGPGQVVAYPLLDLKRLGLHVKEYVYQLENALLHTLSVFGVTGHRVPKAPGVYVRRDDPRAHAVLKPTLLPNGEIDFSGLAKIASIGLKVSQHCVYHGVSLNVDMDLRPFGWINPCGYSALAVTDLKTLGVSLTWHEVAGVLAERIQSRFLG